MRWWEDDEIHVRFFSPYRLMRRLTCIIWHRHPRVIHGSWYSWLGGLIYSGDRCARCGAWLKVDTVVVAGQ